MSKSDQPNQSLERMPIPPDAEKVEGLVSAMSITVGQYCQLHGGNMSDVLSACFTLCHRTMDVVLHNTIPPLSVAEQFRMRGVLTGAAERLWTLAVGGGATSKYKAH